MQRSSCLLLCLSSSLPSERHNIAIWKLTHATEPSCVLGVVYNHGNTLDKQKNKHTNQRTCHRRPWSRQQSVQQLYWRRVAPTWPQDDALLVQTVQDRAWWSLSWSAPGKDCGYCSDGLRWTSAWLFASLVGGLGVWDVGVWGIGNGTVLVGME